MARFEMSLSKEQIEKLVESLKEIPKFDFRFGFFGQPTEENDMPMLLSVDWDFFFPIDETGPNMGLYDWGHRESQFFIEPAPLWYMRAAEFLRLGMPLPLAEVAKYDNGLGWKKFWKRFSLHKDCEIYIADSHAYAWELQHEGRIFSFDAHHDCGYRNGTKKRFSSVKHVDCSNWLGMYLHTNSKCTARIVYPDWRDWKNLEPQSEMLYQNDLSTKITRSSDAMINNTITQSKWTDKIFICRSGAWVPPWLDKAFFDFVEAACQCGYAGKRVKKVHNMDGVKPRDWDEEVLKQYTAELQQAWDQLPKQETQT